jgi:undecaprenyl-diphosphatase
MIELWKAILFGIVEGITEWLPISSTGHMILLNQIMPLREGEDFYSMFEVVIQLGAILAVVLLFWKQIWPFGRKNNRAPLAKSGWGAWIKTDIFQLWFHILVSCVPAAVIGILFNDVFEELFYNYQTVAVMLILFGIAFILIENYHKGKNTKISSLADIGYDTALLIGLFQLIAAIFPGTSRSGATIVGALLIGVSRTVAAEYTFFLAIPVMFGASLLKLVKFGFDFTAQQAMILVVGMVVAFVVSLFVIRFLMDYIKKHDFKVFGWYRIVLGVIVLLCGIAGFVHA